jgi:hypothetical protein
VGAILGDEDVKDITGVIKERRKRDEDAQWGG